MRRPRPPQEVAAAWILTGPAGHLYAGVRDWIEVLGKLARARARGERL